MFGRSTVLTGQPSDAPRSFHLPEGPARRGAPSCRSPSLHRQTVQSNGDGSCAKVLGIGGCGNARRPSRSGREFKIAPIAVTPPSGLAWRQVLASSPNAHERHARPLDGPRICSAPASGSVARVQVHAATCSPNAGKSGRRVSLGLSLPPPSPRRRREAASVQCRRAVADQIRAEASPSSPSGSVGRRGDRRAGLPADSSSQGAIRDQAPQRRISIERSPAARVRSSARTDGLVRVSVGRQRRRDRLRSASARLLLEQN